MEKSIWYRTALFIMSLWLLFIIGFIITLDAPIHFGQDYHFMGILQLLKRNIVPIIFLFGICLCFAIAASFSFQMKGSKRSGFTVEKVENKSFEYIEFLTSIIIPIAFSSLSPVKYLCITVLLLAAIGIIYIKTGTFCANPTLALFGYRIYLVSGKLKGETQEGIIVLSKDKIKQNTEVFYIWIDDMAMIARARR